MKLKMSNFATASYISAFRRSKKSPGLGYRQPEGSCNIRQSIGCCRCHYATDYS